MRVEVTAVKGIGSARPIPTAISLTSELALGGSGTEMSYKARVETRTNSYASTCSSILLDYVVE